MIERLVGFAPYLVWGVFNLLQGRGALGDSADIFWVGALCIVATDVIAYNRARQKTRG